MKVQTSATVNFLKVLEANVTMVRTCAIECNSAYAHTVGAEKTSYCCIVVQPYLSTFAYLTCTILWHTCNWKYGILVLELLLTCNWKYSVLVIELQCTCN